MQNINISNLKHLRFIAVLLTAITVITAIAITAVGLNGTTYAQAEDTAISDATELHTLLRNNGSAGEIGGALTLDSDIVVPINSGYSLATFTGSLDGKQHTITFTGTGEYFFDKDNSTSATNHYAGLLFGQLGEGATIKNVNIVLDGAVRFVAYNGKSTAGGLSHVSASTTLYAGVIAGSSTLASIRDTSLTITQNGAIAAIGIDAQDNATNYASGQGAIIGGMVGSSAGSTFYNVKLNNNGAIFARGDNKNAGETGSDGIVINSSAITNPDRASAGGLIGEVLTNKTSTNTVSNLVLQGNGFIGAATSGDNGMSESTSHNTNFAGLIFGLEATSGSTATTYVVNNASPKVFVTRPVSSDSNYAGTLFGYSLSAKISYMWYQSNGAITQAARGVVYYDNTSTVPTYNTLLSQISLNTVNNNFANCYIGAGILSNQNPRPYSSSGYKGSQVSPESGTATVADVMGGNIIIKAEATGENYISALSTGSHNRYTNIYKDGPLQKSALLSQYTVSASVAEFRVYFATISTEITTNVSGITGDTKTFDEMGLHFTGYPANSLKINDNLCWGYTWTSTDNSVSNTYYGDLGTATLSVPSNAGKYEIALYRQENSNYVKLQNQDAIGANVENAPTIIYMHTGATYNYTIRPASVYIQADPNSSLQKTYDGNNGATSLFGGISYSLYYDEDCTQPAYDTNFKFDFTSGVFGKLKDGNFVTGDYNVGNDYYVQYSGITLTATEEGYCNYKLATNDTTILVANCSITQRRINIIWKGLNDQDVINVTYNGGIAKPEFEIIDHVEGETVTPQFTIKNSNYESISTDFGAKLNVGLYYISPTLPSGGNYNILSNDQPYHVVAKEIALTWTKSTSTYDTIEKNVSVTIPTGEVFSNDVVNVSVQYENLSNGVISAHIKDAGQYKATASIDNDNYLINAQSVTFDDIHVAPAKISINCTSSLLYKAINYAKLPANDPNAPVVQILAPQLDLTNDNVAITYGSNEIINAGSYKLTLSIQSNSSNKINPDNYEVVDPLKTITINPRKVIPEFSVTSSTYDGHAKSVAIGYQSSYTGIANAHEYGIVGTDILSPSLVITNNEGAVIKEVINAGSYVYTYTLNTANYLFVKKVGTVLQSPSVSVSFDYSVNALSLNSDLIKVGSMVDKEYCGQAISPEVELYLHSTSGYKLVYGANADYVIVENSVVNNVNVGTASFAIQGKGNYTGERTCYFNITPKTISVDYTKAPKSITYSGASCSITPAFVGVVSGDEIPSYNLTYYANSTEINAEDLIYTGAYSVKTTLKLVSGVTSNYVLSEEGDTHFFNITPKGVEIVFSNYSDFIYNGTTQYVTASFKAGASVFEVDNASVSIEVSYYILDTYSGSSSDTAVLPIDASGYVAVPRLINLDGKNIKDNYTIVNTKNLTFTIAKYQVDLSYSYSDDIVPIYNGNSQKIICVIDDPDGTLNGILQNSGRILYPTVSYLHKATSTPVQDNTPILAGEYIAYATLSDDKNFKINPDTVYADFVINRKLLTARLFTNVADANARYVYNGQNISPSYTVTGSVENKAIAMEIKFYDTDHRPIFDCINVGNYLVSLTLPNETWATNYILVDEGGIDTSLLEYRSVTITPRRLAAKFNFNATQDYTAKVQEVYADLATVSGYAPGTVLQSNGTILEGSGLIENDVVAFGINRYKVEGSSRVELLEDEEVRNVGKYSFDAYISDNSNYEIYHNGVVVEYITGDLEVQPYEIAFTAKTISKKYGDSDADVDFTQRVAGLEGESIVVTLERDRNTNNYPGGDVEAVYDLYLFVNYTWDNKNYKIIRSNVNDAFFQIVKREVEFEVPTFTFDYLDHDFTANPTLTHTIEVPTSVFGIINVTITLTPYGTPLDAGTYNFVYSREGVDDNESIVTIMKEGSNEDKIIIRGRTVVVNFQDFNITYGQYEPYNGTDDNGVYNKTNYFDFFSITNNDVGLKKCHAEIVDAYNNSDDQANFPWWNYIEIIRERVPGTLIYDENIGLLPVKAGGYSLTVQFKEEAGGDNYSAVKADGSPAVYTLMVDRYDLSNLFGPDKNHPIVETKRDYLGKGVIMAKIKENNNGLNGATIDAVITSQINTELRSQSLYAIATFDNENAGIGKTITIAYAFNVSDYAPNYILPEPFEYPSKGTITALNVTVQLSVEKTELTYGEVPSIDIGYEGFLPGDEGEANVLNLTGVYEDGTALDTIQNVSDTYGYTIVLKPAENAQLTNYNVLYESDSAKAVIVILPKDISLVASGIKYDKLIDGTYTSDVQIGTHMVLEGVINNDEVNVTFDQILKSKEIGETEVTINDIKIDNGNYNLITTKLSVSAIVRNLANVTLDNLTVDFDNTAKSLVPQIDYEDESTANEIETEILYSGVYYDESETAPVNAGVYNVKVFLRYKQYRSIFATAMLTINKIKPKLTFSGQLAQTYGSFSAITATVSAIGLNVEVPVRYSFEEAGAEFPEFPQAGRHTVTASYAETNNYLAVSGNESLLIRTKAITVTFENYKDLVYNGYTRESEINVILTGIVEGDTCEPIKEFSALQVKNAGTYRVTVTPSNPSYTISGSNSVEFSIGKKKLTVYVEDGITTKAGVAPKFTILYDGFVENEDENDLAVKPTVKAKSGQVGTNLVEYNEGSDENYYFDYKLNIYTITYEPKQDSEKNITPYVVGGGVVGGIGIVVALAFAVRAMNYRSVVKHATKRAIKKSLTHRK